MILNVIYNLILSKSRVKKQFSVLNKKDPSLLPYNEDVLKIINDYSSKGYEIVLSTGASSFDANNVAEHLGMFNKIISSDDSFNNVGHSKLKKLLELGYDNFIYLADSKSDLPIWNYCKNAVTVNCSKITMNKLKSNDVSIHHSINNNKNYLRVILNQLRVHQWVKNILIFVPILAAHSFVNLSVLINSVSAFLSFSLLASSVYIFNDIIDLDDDRRHPQKKNRPIAGGYLSIDVAVLILIVCFSCSLLLAFNLSYIFLIICICYILLNILYSNFIKKIIILDIVLLTTFYMIRLACGFTINSVEFSIWLTGFFFFLFFSLGTLKRYIDLIKYDNLKSVRGYSNKDSEILKNLGFSSGLMGTIILILYSLNEKIETLYNSPNILLLLSLIYIYWIARIWLLANREIIDSDPVKFALKDKVSYIVIITALIIVFFATYI